MKFVGWLKDLGFEDVTMTTNGFLLKENLEGLIEAGLDRINISLDTLQPEKFAFITRRNHFEKVWESVMAALETPLSPVKINAVAMRGVNDDEIAEMAKLTLRYPMHVRFIELMPLNGDTDGSRFRSFFVSGSEILERAQDELGELTPIEPDDPAAPADEFKFEGAPGTFGVITPVSEPFCARCSRLRLTADGKIHPCLLTDLDVPVKDAIRSGRPDSRDPRGPLGHGPNKARRRPHPPGRVAQPHDEPDRGLATSLASSLRTRDAGPGLPFDSQRFSTAACDCGPALYQTESAREAALLAHCSKIPTRMFIGADSHERL